LQYFGIVIAIFLEVLLTTVQVSGTQGDNEQDCEIDKAHEKVGGPENTNRNDGRTQNSKGN